MLANPVGARWLGLAALLMLAACGGSSNDDDNDPRPGGNGTMDGGTQNPDPQKPDGGGPVDPDPDPDPDGGTVVTPGQVIVDLRADVNRDGVVSLTGTADDQTEETWTPAAGAVFLANIDDDGQACTYSNNTSDVNLPKCHDAADEVVNGADDVLDLAPLKIAAWPEAPDSAEGTLTVSASAVNLVRFFKKTGNSYTAFKPGADYFTGADLRAGVELALEGKDIVRNAATWDGYVDVTFRVTAPAASGKAAVDQSDKVRLRVSPVMTFHHLSPTETAYVSAVPTQGGGTDPESAKFVNDLNTVLGGAGMAGKLVTIPVQDQWTQDFFETGYAAMPKAGGGQHVMRVNFRSANVESSSPSNPLRFAGRIVFVMRGKDVAAVQQYDTSPDPYTQSLNSFGNHETVPPYSYNGQTYPLGRMLRGSVPSFAPDRSFTRMLEGQKVQPPIYVDTSWLLVGHVDETVAFVKANTPRGWAVLVNDPTMARTMLQNEVSKGNGGVRMFVGKYWATGAGETAASVTISQVLADTEVMAESARSAAEVEAQVAILKQQTGLTDAEIIRIPYLHQPVDGYSLAYQPGTVNGFYLNDTTFIAPDPFGPVIGGKDIFKDQMERALAPIGLGVKWVDDWDLYHRLAGEVHCGTNAARAIPAAKWWESGR